MISLFQALHVLAAARGDGLRAEFLRCQPQAGAMSNANEKSSPGGQRKKEPTDEDAATR